MRKKSEISEEEQKLFRDTMQGIAPIKQNKAERFIKKVKIKQIKTEPNEIEEDSLSEFENLPEVGSDDLLQFFRPGIQHKVLRNLRNGKYNVEAILDLHGMTVIKAKQALIQFLAQCQQKKIKYVLIIHGKGHITHKPILKNKLNHWLRQIDQVLAFNSATYKEGRGGALYALLKVTSQKYSDSAKKGDAI